MERRRPVPTTKKIGHAYLNGLNKPPALRAMWAGMYHKAKIESARLVSEGRHREAGALMKNILLGIKGNQKLARARGLI